LAASAESLKVTGYLNSNKTNHPNVTITGHASRWP